MTKMFLSFVIYRYSLTYMVVVSSADKMSLCRNLRMIVLRDQLSGFKKKRKGS